MRPREFTWARQPVRFVLLLAGLLGAVWSFAAARQASIEADEKQVRQAAFRYYAGLVLADETMCLDAVSFPLYSVRNGTGSMRDQKALRALVAEVTRRREGAAPTDEQRKQIAANVLAIFDDASIQFIGGDTASVVFVVKPATDRTTGDNLAELVLYRKAGKWRVIAEFTDSKPAPPLSVPEHAEETEPRDAKAAPPSLKQGPE
jgi:hypothetical protein